VIVQPRVLDCLLDYRVHDFFDRVDLCLDNNIILGEVHLPLARHRQQRRALADLLRRQLARPLTALQLEDLEGLGPLQTSAVHDQGVNDTQPPLREQTNLRALLLRLLQQDRFCQGLTALFSAVDKLRLLEGRLQRHDLVKMFTKIAAL
jgi:hypothetical protein